MMNQQEEEGMGGHVTHIQQPNKSEMMMAVQSTSQFQQSIPTGQYPSSGPTFSSSQTSSVSANGGAPFGVPSGQSQEHNPHGLMANQQHHGPTYGGSPAAPSGMSAASQSHHAQHQQLYGNARPMHHHQHHGMAIQNHAMMGSVFAYMLILERPGPSLLFAAEFITRDGNEFGSRSRSLILLSKPRNAGG